MLALSRKVGESIIIADNIEITILDVSRDQVKLGINAPKHISIHRKEVYLQIQEENQAANVATEAQVDALKNIFKKD